MQKPTLNVALMQKKIEERYGKIARFAAAAGVSRQYANDVVNGKAVPSITRVVQFAELLDVSVDDLLGSPKGEALTITAGIAQPSPAVMATA